MNAQSVAGDLAGWLKKVSIKLRFDRKVKIIQMYKQEKVFPEWSRMGARVHKGKRPGETWCMRDSGNRELKRKGWQGPSHSGPGMQDKEAWTLAIENLVLAGGIVKTKTMC